MDQPEGEATGGGPDNREDIQIFIYSDLDVGFESSVSSDEEDSAGWESDKSEESEEGQIPEQRESEEYRRLEAEAFSYLTTIMDYADMLVKRAAQKALQEASQVRASENTESEISVGVEFPAPSCSEPELLTAECQTDVETSSTACGSVASSDSGLPGVSDEDAVQASPPLPVRECVDCSSLEDNATSLAGDDDATSLTREDDVLSNAGIGRHFLCGVKSAGETGSAAPDGRFGCGVCGKVFTLERSLYFHQWRMHNAPHPKYAGKVVPQSVETKVKSPTAKVKSAVAKVKSPEAKVKCPPKSPGAARSPGKQRKAGEERRYVCDQCDAVFKRPLSLRKHKERAPGDARCRCEVCNRDFCERIALKTHRIIHTKSVSFECKECNKVLSSNFSLRRHMYSVHQRPNQVAEVMVQEQSDGKNA